MTATFMDYYENFERFWGARGNWEDIRKGLELFAERPGGELSFSEIAQHIGGDSPEDRAARTIPVITALTAGSNPIGRPFFKVLSADGNLYPAGLVDKDTREGRKPFVLEATGETVENFATRAYVYIRLEDFAPDLSPSGPASPAP